MRFVVFALLVISCGCEDKRIRTGAGTIRAVDYHNQVVVHESDSGVTTSIVTCDKPAEFYIGMRASLSYNNRPEWNPELRNYCLRGISVTSF